MTVEIAAIIYAAGIVITAGACFVDERYGTAALVFTSLLWAPLIVAGFVMLLIDAVRARLHW